MKNNNKLLHAIKRGLSGYVSYLAACQMGSAFSEYILYEPMLRILKAFKCKARCEVPCHGLSEGSTRGDKKRLDFEVLRNGIKFAIEVKWARRPRVNAARDYEKLAWYHSTNEGAEAYLLIFGRKRELVALDLTPDSFVEIGEPLYAEFGNTKYGCRVFRTKKKRN